MPERGQHRTTCRASPGTTPAGCPPRCCSTPSGRCSNRRPNSAASRAISPQGTRAIDLPDEAVPSQFLDVFGRPARNSACECERVDAPGVGPDAGAGQFARDSGQTSSDKGYVKRSGGQREAARGERPRHLSAASSPARRGRRNWRSPSQFLESETDRKEAYASLLWSLLATNEFLFNH